MNYFKIVLLCGALALGSLTGCGEEKTEEPKEPEVKQEEQQETEEKTEAEETEEKKTEEAEEAEKAEEDVKTEKETVADIHEDMVLTSIRDNGGTRDYTSLEELNLEPGGHVAVVVKNTKSGYWLNVKKGMEAAVKDMNDKMGFKGDDRIKLSFEGPADEIDVESQINIIDAVLSENPSVLCLAAVDMESCVAQLEAAAENGIPVVMLDSGINKCNEGVICATDNKKAGAEAAIRLCDAIGAEGKVAVVAHNPSTQTSFDRETGFTEELMLNHPGLSVAGVIHEEEDVITKDAVKEFLTQNPDVKGIFCTNQNVSEQVLDAVAESGLEGIQVIGFDAGKKQKEAVKNGTEAGMVVQNPFGMGYATVVVAARAWQGLENDPFINSGYQWIDNTNVEQTELKNYLYD